MTPPGWNGWLHHTVDIPPTEESYKPRAWELPHRGNPTGTPAAIRPQRLDLAARPATGRRGGDYQAWTPS